MKTTVRYDGVWIVIYAAVLAVLLVSLGVSLRGQGARIIAGGRARKAMHVFVGILGFGMLAAFGVLSGVPVVLHFLTSAEGEMIVTVTGKDELHNRRKCQPRLLIKEFTFFMSDHICPGKHLFDEIEVGEKIKLTGKLSSFGISPREVNQFGGHQPVPRDGA